jgi:hypothetical protein
VEPAKGSARRSARKPVGWIELIEGELAPLSRLDFVESEGLA